MEAKKHTPIAVLGAGSWGSALSLYLARRGQEVQLWSIDETEIKAICSTRKNERYLPGIEFPENISATTDLAEALQLVDDVLVVVPSIGFRDTLTKLKAHISRRTRVICATKGFDTDAGLLLGEVASEVLSDDQPFAVLSGPSFAKEVAAGLPAAVVIASKYDDVRETLYQRFNSELLNIQTTDDVTGVEIGGGVKNVIAIATGISDGMALGSNMRSALITLGLQEMIRLGEKLGAKIETMIGLAGMGDLILTCSDDLSRNRRLGLALGQGKTIAAAEKEIGQAIEGKRNAKLVVHLANSHSLHMPICEMVWDILEGKCDPATEFKKLLAKSCR